MKESKRIEKGQTAPPLDDEKDDFESVNDIYYQKLKYHSLSRSMDHQRKFMARRHSVPTLFPIEDRYQPNVSWYAAVVVSAEWVFLHIWKCGGTTVADMTPEHQRALHDPEIQERRWFGMVRDPIDRYISAWAECGMRLFEQQSDIKGFENETALYLIDEDYDFRLRSWLPEVKKFRPPHSSCHTHAFPQANYMLNAEGEIDEHVAFVADLSDLRKTLQMVQMPLGPEEMGLGRDASKDEIKKTLFMARRDLLSEQTLIELCEYYAIDYYLFDFEPPEVCIFDGGPLSKFIHAPQAIKED